MKEIRLDSPLNGQLIELKDVKAPAFASGAMGKGAAVKDPDGKVYSPVDGTVTVLFGTKHAIGMKAADGTEYLLHIGVDTVNLGGKGFEVFVENGQKVKKGDKLMHFDDAFIKANAKSDACLVIFTGLQEGQSIQMEKTGAVKALDEVAKF